MTSQISRNVKPRLGGDRFAWFVDVLGKILRCSCLFSHFLFEMPQWCIAYGCTNSSDMEIKKSWHRLPLENKELLSKWLAKIRRTNTNTNTPVNEHSRLCGDHFEADCFKKIPGSSRVNLKPGSIPSRFCFVQEKTPWKLLAERKSVDRKQPRLNVNNPSDDIAECEIDNMELEIEESEEERLRRRIKELELSYVGQGKFR